MSKITNTQNKLYKEKHTEQLYINFESKWKCQMTISNSFNCQSLLHSEHHCHSPSDW
jgi:hypothetical protein